MASQKTINKVKDLEHFLEALEQYLGYISLHKRKGLTGKQETETIKLRDALLEDIGRFKGLITELAGKEGVTIDMWLEAFGLPYNRSSTLKKLLHCADVTRMAIGKIKLDIEQGIRDEQGNLIEKPVKNTEQTILEVSPESVLREVPPSVFISHGKESVALRKLKEFIETLGIEPLIVKKQASLDKDLPDKVNLYLNQADFVIILATGDDTVRDKKTGEEIRQPRQNVIHEIGLAQKTHPGRVIYLLEEGANFPSNIRPRVWESFKQRNMMDAFLGIVRELRAYGILKVIRHPVE